MIKVLNVKNFTTFDTGWMDPYGKFYPCDYMGHLALADEIYREIYHVEDPPNDAEQILLRNNWCEIQIITYLEHGFLVNFEYGLTPEQIAAIEPVYIRERECVIKSNRYDIDEEIQG